MANTKKKTARLYLRLPEQLKRRIERAAMARGLDSSKLVRIVMQENLK